MKTITNNRRAELLAGMAISASLFIGAQSPVVAGQEESNKDKQGFIEKMERWQDKMSEKFKDAWKSLRGEAKGKSVTAAALDVREDQDNYTVRLHLPDRDIDKMEVKLQGDTLRILEPSGSSTRYEQSLKLTGIASGAQPKIEREPKDNMIVLTVPKGATSDEGELGSTLSLPSLSPLSDWDRDVFASMEKMRREMDRVFEEGFREFRAGQHKGFFDEPRFGSSVDIKEEGGNYVVRAYLPDRDMENVNVTVKDQTLKIEAKAEKESDRKEGERALRSAVKAAYSQLLTLPGPVHSEKMKVEKKEGMLVVTLPKA
jgi:HSP20 family molecular chaperone IbpA